MDGIHYVGLDVHKKTISYCVKRAAGEVVAEGKLPATRGALEKWMAALPQPWSAAMEATYSPAGSMTCCYLMPKR